MPKPNPLDHTNHQKGSSSVSRLDGLPVGMPYKLYSPYRRMGSARSDNYNLPYRIESIL